MQTIYIGDNVRKYNLQQNRVYLNRPTEIIEKLGKVNPLVEKLFVPVNELTQAQKDLRTQGTPIYAANMKLRGE